MKRIPRLDGLRGILALTVMLGHAVDRAAIDGPTMRILTAALDTAGELAVCMFFVLSAHVLTRAWDDRFLLFLTRRFVRLWPVYAVCLTAGYGLAGQTPHWSEYAWYPVASPTVDPPGWSLCVEAWAMLSMPAIVWFTHRKRVWRLVLGVMIWIGLSLVNIKFIFGGCFLLGAALPRYEPQVAMLDSEPVQWLGKVSYSLYLSHWLVLSAALSMFGAAGAIAAIPVTLVVGWAVWWTVERPSLLLSRRIGMPRIGAGLAMRASR